MSKRIVVACIAGLLLATLLPAANAQSVILGTAQIEQDADGSCVFDARWFDRDGANSDWQDNRSYSIVYEAPINEKTAFGLVYSNYTALGDVPGPAVAKYDREVLSPSIKRVISGAGSSPTVAFTIGADVAIKQAEWVNQTTGLVVSQNDFTPAARLQLEWGTPGAMQFQIAGQVAFFDSLAAVNMGSPVADFGTITVVGGGISLPVGGALSLVADALVPVDGDNSFNKVTGDLEDEVVWSAGGSWQLQDRWNSSLRVYATNSVGPTLASSALVSPNNDIGYGVSYSRGF